MVSYVRASGSLLTFLLRRIWCSLMKELGIEFVVNRQLGNGKLTWYGLVGSDYCTAERGVTAATSRSTGQH